jgi:CspA family cold shock protein
MPPFGSPRPPRFGAPSSAPRHPSTSPHSERVDAVVKWFNPAKGFGFVTVSESQADAFLPGSLLRDTGHDALPDGTHIVVDVGTGAKGEIVTRIHSVDMSSAPAPSRAPRFGAGGGGGGGRDFGGGGGRDYGGGGGGDSGGANLGTTQGTVKWFNPSKGFGFVAPDGGGKDVFVHVSALERSGLHTLDDGERVEVELVQGKKGVEARRITPLGR